jgi:O-antigen/teichoic acid export membrane protein
MKNKKRLDSSLNFIAKSSFIVFISILFSKLFTYFYRIIIARNFGQEIYGIFSLSLVILGFLLAISSLGLQNGLLRYISLYRGKSNKNKIRYLFQTCLKIIVPFSLIIGIFLILFSNPLSILFNNQELGFFLRWLSFFIPLSAIGGTFHVILKSYEEVKWYSFIGNILVPLSQLLFLLLFIFLKLEDKSILISYNLATSLLFLSSFILCKIKIPELFKKPQINKKLKINLLKEIFSYSWPIIFLGLISTIFSSTDTFMLGFLRNVNEVGIYNTAVPLAGLLQFIPLLFLQFFFPLVTKEYSNNRIGLIREISKQVNKWIFMLNLPFLILMLFFPGAIINLFFGVEYLAAQNVLRFLSIGVFFYSLGTISDNLLSMAGKSKINLFNLCLAGILNIFLNSILIPKFGINGAAFATMITYLSWTGLSIYWTKKNLSIIPFNKKMIRIILVSIIPTLIILIIKSFLEITQLTALLLGTLFILLYLFSLLITKCFDNKDLTILKLIRQSFFKKLNLNLPKTN